ncbi:hypothetical protein MRX96_019586 [Rhipicephalus microplus]
MDLCSPVGSRNAAARVRRRVKSVTLSRAGAFISFRPLVPTAACTCHTRRGVFLLRFTKRTWKILAAGTKKGRQLKGGGTKTRAMVPFFPAGGKGERMDAMKKSPRSRERHPVKVRGGHRGRIPSAGSRQRERAQREGAIWAERPSPANSGTPEAAAI